MAQYKVLQDIEAEDKLVGPLTLRQFIYAGITAVCLYICFIAITNGVLFILPVFLLPAILTGFFAFPWGRDQPTEIWALAKIRFLVKPRRRIWDQSGAKQLVTVTAPKRIEINYTNGLSQPEVRSRLKALADTIDSRGWAIKNVTTGLYVQPGQDDSERLVGIDTFGEAPTEDMLDTQNPVSQTFDRMMQKSDQAHRAQIMQTMAQTQQPAVDQSGPQLPAPQISTRQQAAPSEPPAAPADNYWFLSQAPGTPAAQTQIVAPGSDNSDTGTKHVETAEEKVLAQHLREQNDSQSVSYSHLHTVLPLAQQRALAQKAAREAAAARTKQAAQAPVTRQPDPAIIALASNNDLNVATIARQANHKSQEPPDEVVISLH